jgi:hypothetical protein
MPNMRMMSTAIAIVIAAILGIATSSIASECFNKHESYKTEKKSNFDFVVINLVCNILMLLLGFICTYLAIQSPA